MKTDDKKQAPVVREQSEAYSDDMHQGLPLIEERYETIDGVRYDMQPSPTLQHQLVIMELYKSIDVTCHAAGTVIVAPMDVHLDEDNVVQPDLTYVANENAHILKTRIQGVPDLLVEVLSPSTGMHDKVRKRALYERFGVPEYWIVDIHHRVIDQHVLTDGKYVLERSYAAPDVLLSARFPCIAVRLRDVFQVLGRIQD